MKKIIVAVDYATEDDYLAIVLMKMENDVVEIFKEFTSETDFIFWLFKHRCIGLDTPCNKYATEISHIVPRSSGKKSQDWHNLVLHCSSCHNEYHRRGVSDEAIEKMQERRAEYLEMIGRGEYI